VIAAESVPGILATMGAMVTVLTVPGPYGNMFYFHVYKTAEMLFTTLAVSLVLGTVIGVALGTNETLESSVSSWIYAWLAIPSLVIVFVAAVLIGFNASSGYFAVPAVITPFVALNMWEGARNLDPQLREMADFFGASRYQQFTDVIIPQLVPFLFASIRSGLSIGWKITLLVEAFLVTRGVGFMFRRYFDQYDLTTMMSWLILFVVLLVVIEYGVLAPLHSRVTSWRPDADGVRLSE
jgi:NitT/TauT family transport system permease protein